MNPIVTTGVTYQDWQLVLLSSWSTARWVVALAAALAALLLSWWGCRRQRRALRLLLVGLRALAVGAVLFVVLQPALQLRSVTRVPNHVAVLLDSSASMALREGPRTPARRERAAALFARSRPRLAAWRREHLVDAFTFHSELSAAGPLDQPQRAEGPATRLGVALEQLHRRYAAGALAGVLVVSDGIDNGVIGRGPLSAEVRRLVRALGAPIHTAWIGGLPVRDLAVGAVHADDFAFVRNVVKVEVELIATGVAPGPLTVTLARGRRVVASRTLLLQPHVERYATTFELVPPRVGKFVYTVSVPLQPGEALASNNERSFLLQVIRDRVRVLQVCGRPSWDERFLRHWLKRDPNVDLISFFILRTPASLSLAPTSELSLIPFPTDELFDRELGSFDLVILQDFNFAPYGIGAYLPQLRRYVEQGGALAMVGGALSFSSGGYAGTPVGAILPVRLLPASTDERELLDEDDFQLRPTPRGLDHPILRLGRDHDETQALLARLPPLAGANRLGAAWPDATVLATHPKLRLADGQPMPVLAVRAVGRGRTLALATDSLWHWAFLGLGEPGDDPVAYDQFWRNAIRWLIKDPALQQLRVLVQRDRLPLGAEAQWLVRAYALDYGPARGLELEYGVTRLSATLPPVPLLRRRAHTNDQGELQLGFRAPQAGAYRLWARAVIGGRRSYARELLLVEAASLEGRELQARDGVLRELSQRSGGQFLGAVSTLPALPWRPSQVLHVNWRHDVELWNSPYTLVLVVLLLGLEWTARRRFGHF
ncbi:MAG: hypothetical protein IPG96_21215 [Proteobacteria bacterium]|nr:hypothetical protein [Pseudomonadota bacterium]